MKQVIFTGAATALVTPFQKDGSIAWDELERLVEFQVQGGIDAIVACGTTGEAATMTTDVYKRQERHRSGGFPGGFRLLCCQYEKRGHPRPGRAVCTPRVPGGDVYKRQCWACPASFVTSTRSPL